MTWLAVKDNAEGTLLNNIDSFVTEIPLNVNQGQKFPSAGFALTIDNEKMYCSSRTTDTLTVERAYDGSEASDHASGAKVELRVITKHITDITDAVDEIQTFETEEVIPHLDSTDLHWKEHNHSGAGNAGGSLSTSSLVNGEIPGGTPNGVLTAFTTASAYTTGSLKVFKNGIRLKGGGNDYTEVANGFTMVTAPATGTVLLVDYNTVPSVFATGSTSFIYSELCGGTPNGTLTAFTTASSYVSLSTAVFLDGVRMRRGVDYTETNSTTITFSSAPLTGSEVLIDYQSAVSVSGNADTLDGFHEATFTRQTFSDALKVKTDYLSAPDTGWIAPTLQNNWVNYGGYPEAGYRKDAMGYVHLRGFVKNGTATDSVQIFALPAGYRASGTLHMQAAGSVGNGHIKITTTGVSYGAGTGNGWLSFEGITFLAEN